MRYGACREDLHRTDAIGNNIIECCFSLFVLCFAPRGVWHRVGVGRELELGFGFGLEVELGFGLGLELGLRFGFGFGLELGF